MTPDRWEQIARIYDDARDRPAGERDAFVVAATAGDDELRREVESLLAQDPETCLLDRPALESAGGLLDPDVTLHPGAQLGPYRIEGVVGAGGMGHVYRATDTRLHRTVAIKVLRSRFASDRQFRERFDREAKAIAALTHPHICALHDVRSEGGIDFLVFEFLEGETLAARLERGALPLDQAVRHAVEIANALATAHHSGIIHRDLKPGNIVLTRTGAKLLDFGLAKGVDTAVSGHGASAPLTLLAGEVTAEGTILGTVQYMAPEQLEGRPADMRTDIFAFGAVVYQMIAGRRPFQGSSPASVIGAILKDDPPPLDKNQPLTPPLLDHVVRRCLAKDPDERWQSTADLARELRWAAEAAPSTGASVVEHSPSRVRRVRLTAVAILSLLAAGAAGALWLRRPADRAPRTTRFQVSLAAETTPLGSTFATGLAFPNFAVAHDGSRIVFRLGANNQSGLAMRWIDRIAPVALEGTVGANQPYFSPDDQWIAFHTQGRLRKLRLAGGRPIELCVLGAPGRGGTWLADGSIVFATTAATTGLLRVAAEGGAPAALTTPDAQSGERDHVWPSALSAHQVLFTILGAAGRAPRVAVLDVNTGQRTVVLQNAAQAQYVEHDGSGYLLYESAHTVYGVGFDRARLEVRGEPTAIAADVQSASAAGRDFAASQEGTLVYAAADSGKRGARTLVWVDRSGREQVLDAPPRAYMTPRLSPDGRRVAVVIADPLPSIWIWDIERKDLTPLSPELESGLYPVWAPGDPARIIFMSERAGPPNLFGQQADGSVAVEHLIVSERPQFAGSVSTNGLLFISQLSPPTQGDIGVVDLAKPARVQMVIDSRATEASPEISPDGKWLAYQSNESGIDEVWIRPFPVSDGARIKISTGGGVRPAWAPSGREIFYLDSSGHLTSVRLTVSGTSLNAGRPARLFETTYYGGVGRPFDLSSDGRRFLMVKGEAPTNSTASLPALTVVQNWVRELTTPPR